MECPRCEKTVLEERERDGIVIDLCSRCRGIWLDRGELEKLIARATRDLAALEPRYDDRRAAPARERRDDDDRDRRYPKRKRSWLESLGEIFD